MVCVVLITAFTEDRKGRCSGAEYRETEQSNTGPCGPQKGNDEASSVNDTGRDHLESDKPTEERSSQQSERSNYPGSQADRPYRNTKGARSGSIRLNITRERTARKQRR